MAPRRVMLTPEQHRNLVKKYNICFDGRTLPSSWPAQYAEIFQNILDIKRLGYDEYKPNEGRRIFAVAEMKDRVARLNRIAHICRGQRENEATWRGLTEPEIVCRFAEEVACRICHKRLWDAEFKALPHDPTEVKALKNKRNKREFCCCSLEDKATKDDDDSDGAQLFLSRFQTRFVHDPADRLGEEGLRCQAPDRVFGLRETSFFNRLAAAQEGLQQSPYGDGKVLYPFLIVEAKSEKGSSGFESIENQTAFPIRRLLKLQYDLGTVSDRGIKPLVWFLANQGEEWRVYGSILDDSTWRVIKLWHGSLLSKDETLQLLLIMDYICDWARDIYRRDIVRCLEAEDVDMRDTTPAYTTTTSSQRDESSSLPHSPSLPTPRRPSPGDPALTDQTSDAEGNDIDMEDTFPNAREDRNDESFSTSDSNDENDHSLTSADSSNQQPLLRFAWSQDNQRPWSRRATIRHANMVQFKFRHFTVPEESKALEVWLDCFQARGGSNELSRTLLQHIETGNALTITMNGILQLENLWTRTNHQSSSKNDQPILALIWFHSHVQRGDWQVVRELKCLTISQPTIIKLATIAGLPRSLSPHDWDVHRCHCLITDAQLLRSFCGRDSIISALLDLRLRLESFAHAGGEVHFRWNKRPDDGVDAVSRTERFWRSIDPEAVVLAPVWSHRSSSVLLEELSPGTVVPPFLTSYLRVNASFGVKGAVLVKKSRVQPRAAHCPTYCLWVFDETDFDDEPCLGEKIIQVFSSGDIYVEGTLGQLERVKSPSESDKSALELWADILCGRAPAYA